MNKPLTLYKQGQQAVEQVLYAVLESVRLSPVTDYSKCIVKRYLPAVGLAIDFNETTQISAPYTTHATEY